jgi:hypothetical protein
MLQEKSGKKTFAHSMRQASSDTELLSMSRSLDSKCLLKETDRVNLPLLTCDLAATFLSLLFTLRFSMGGLFPSIYKRYDLQWQALRPTQPEPLLLRPRLHS